MHTYTINRFIRRAILVLLPAAFAVAGCRKSATAANNVDGGGQPAGDTSYVPAPTPVGTPAGNAEQVTISPAGGTFTTADNRLLLDFPAGAVTASTTFTIQPVKNNCPGGVGLSYLVTPHNVVLHHPVTLTLSYGDSDVINSIPLALTVASQDTGGYWHPGAHTVKDTLHKKVTVQTDHFSSWSLFHAFEMTPAATVVPPGGSVNLYVTKYTDVTGDSLLPVAIDIVNKEAAVKAWQLAGAGQLMQHPGYAVYTAPGAVPAVNPVTVSAALNLPGPGKYILASNIYIGNEGLTFRIDNGPWMGGPSEGVIFTGYNYELTAANKYTPQNDGVTITWTGSTHLNEFAPWKILFPSFLYGEQPTITYNQLLLPQGKASPGGIYFDKAFKTDATPYAIGVFYLQPAQKVVVAPGSIPQYSIHRIEGFFRVKWK
ncbi:MAG TPA: hypothetical protein VHB48_00105 [Chitinophagaceae bacterium]|nr:hypothetical protein [Chitinophagaceae bacterium]